MSFLLVVNNWESKHESLDDLVFIVISKKWNPLFVIASWAVLTKLEIEITS